jgi:hypothetical protein
MKPKPKPTRDGPLSIPLPFDEAIQRALQVKPPPEGWAEHERRLRQRRKKRLQEHKET